MRTRDTVQGTRSGLQSDGAAVALMVELMSFHSMLPEHAPLSSYRSKGKVVPWRYGQATQALKEIVKESGADPDQFTLHSLRIGGASTLAAGGTVSERVIQREGRWKSGAYKVYTRNNKEDISRVSRNLAGTRGGSQRQPGQDTVWGKL